jgi:hypothetical protein
MVWIGVAEDARREPPRRPQGLPDQRRPHRPRRAPSVGQRAPAPERKQACEAGEARPITMRKAPPCGPSIFTATPTMSSTLAWSAGRSQPRRAQRPHDPLPGAGPDCGVAAAQKAARVASALGKPRDGWPAVSRLVTLAFHEDPDVARLAAQELLDRIDLPAIPLALDDGRRRVIRREASP